MARKFVLIPQPMYQSLLGASSGGLDDTLAYARAQLNSVLTDPTTSVAEKNVIYGKRLHDFLKLRKEVEDRPVKVEVTNPTQPQLPIPLAPQASNAALSKPTPRKKRRKGGANEVPPDNVKDLLRILAENHDEYGVNEHGQILNLKNRAIPRSDYARSVRHLLGDAGEPEDLPGTKELKSRLATSSVTRRYLFPDAEPAAINQAGGGAARHFKPTLWKY